MNIFRSPRSPRPPEDLDGLIRAFMRSEMPDPWPAVPSISEPSARGVRPGNGRWFHLGSRFALAATLAACLVGFLALGSMFPSLPPASREPASEMGPIGLWKPFSTTLPDGHKVKGWEKKKGNTVTFKIELDEVP
jgi:hypothetical protein